MSSSWKKTSEIDEDFYSRQLYVLGKEAMLQLAHAHVLISGMRGLGVEIAKNIILGGAKSVIVHDCGTVDYTDLSSQYYFAESDIGKNRVETVLQKVTELNSYVTVTSSSEPIDKAFLAKTKVNIFVLTDANLDDQIIVGDYCHANGIKFIIANTRGLFGQIFCDFGENFRVLDTNGEDPLTYVVIDINQDKTGIVCIETDTKHGFEDGSYVTFHGVKGMTELNDGEYKISIRSPLTLNISDTRDFGVYQGGGTVTEVKTAEVVHFKSFSESLREPEILISDFSKMFMPVNLHLAFQALSQFEKQYQTLPRPWDEADAEKFYELVEQLNSQNPDKVFTDELNKHWIKLFAKTCRGDLCPMQAIIGGIAAQEAMKAVTGKFMPIRQYLYFDAIECLPKNLYEPSEEASAPKLPTKQSRYYSQELIFGEDFQEKICKSKYFVIGAGAIGCEILKNFAMMGIGSDKDGVVVVSDMNAVKNSDLNRQFLFRPADIGKLSSNVAAEAARTMNSRMNVRAYVEDVTRETEHIYHEKFFEQLNGLIDASNNYTAHQYIDRRCSYNRTPLIHSRTIGTKANVQVIIPFLTETYSPTNNSSETVISAHAIHTFSALINHTTAWASKTFADLFVTPIQQAREFLCNPKEFAERQAKNVSAYDRNEAVANVKRILVSERPKDFSDCIRWSRNLFQQKFHNIIAQLVYKYPQDLVSSRGQRFWSGNKRCPHVLHFDVNNSTHADFIVAASNLLAYIYHIPQTRDRQYIADMISKVQVPEFRPKADINFHETDKQLTSYTTEEILDYLPTYDEIRDIQIRVHEFEKDDDSNFHMDYIAATANLRAENYDIQTAERSKIKRIVGKIIPTIVTTTAMVAGLVCLEIYKLIQGHKNIESYRNTLTNLALPFIGFSEPVPPKQQKYLDKYFTLWDRFEVKDDMIIEEFLDYFKKEYKLSLNMISNGMSVLYSPHFIRAPSLANNMKRKLSEVYESVTKKKIPDHVCSLQLDVLCDDLEGNDIEDVPYIKCILR